jgi:Ca2+-binding RTX toxin-like protein
MPITIDELLNETRDLTNGADELYINISATNSLVRLLGGNDRLLLYGIADTFRIQGGDGHDHVTISSRDYNSLNMSTSQNIIFEGGEGNDAYQSLGELNGKHYGGNGNDFFEIGSDVDASFYPEYYFGTTPTGNKSYGSFGQDTFRYTIANNNLASGGSDNDIFNLVGSAGNTLSGGSGNDTVTLEGYYVPEEYDFSDPYATPIRDVIYFGSDDNTIRADGGDDTLTLTNGNRNTVFMGSGADTVNIQAGLYGVAPGANSINGESGNDVLTSSSRLRNTLNGGDGNDRFTLLAGANDHILNGDAGNDRFTLTQNRTMQVNGGIGNDSLSITRGSQNAVNMGDGDDRVTFTDSSTNTVALGAGNDVFRTNRPTSFTDFTGNVVDGGLGDDSFLLAHGGTDNTYRGGSGNDSILLDGVVTNSRFYGDAGADTIEIYSATTSTVLGGSDNDKIKLFQFTGGTADGGLGDDTLEANASSSVLRGGYGNDRITLHNATVRNTLAGDAGNDVLIDLSSLGNNFYGGEGDDRFEGGLGNDTYNISNSTGADRLYDSQGQNLINITVNPLNVVNTTINFTVDIDDYFEEFWGDYYRSESLSINPNSTASLLQTGGSYGYSSEIGTSFLGNNDITFTGGSHTAVLDNAVLNSIIASLHAAAGGDDFNVSLSLNYNGGTNMIDISDGSSVVGSIAVA